MAIDFPSSPANNQTFTDSNTGTVYVYNNVYSVWTSQYTLSTGTANNANYLGGLYFSNYVNNTTLAAYNYINATAVAANLANYQTTAGLAANVAALPANAATYLNGKTEPNLNVNNALTANSAAYLGSTIASAYLTIAGLSTNIVSLSVNAASYLNGKPESNLNVNSAVTANSANSANNASYLGTIAAANFVQNSGAYTISGIRTHVSNIVFNTGSVIVANGSFGGNSYVLTSNGSSMYWGQGITVSDTPPSSPYNGNLWYYTGSGELFVYYDDGTSSQWVTTAATYVPSVISTLSVSGNASFSSNVTISNTRISANGSTGTAGQVLTSSGTGANVYWSTPSSGITTGKSIAMAIVFGG